MPGVGVRGVGVTGGISLAARVAAMFRNGEQGVWYDPSDRATLFQDAAGTTPVTAMEQPVGLMLDKSKGLALGPELVTNGGFDSDTGWSKGTGWTISGGKAVSAGSNAFQPIAQSSISLVSGKWYKVTVEVTRTSGSLILRLGSGTNKAEIATSGTWTGRVFADGAGFSLLSNATGYEFVGSIDNISVRELPGNHAYQSTSASRPVLSARVNQYLNTATLSTQNVTTLATTYTLRFEGAGSITLSGTATGTYTAGAHSVVCTAGTLTSTVTGTVTNADLRPTNAGVNLPPYQRVTTSTDYDTAGFPAYLKFDGIDDSLVTNNIDFTATDKMSVFAGVRKLSASPGIITELSPNSATNNGAFYLAINDIGGAERAAVHGLGAGVTAAGFVATVPSSYVHVANFDVSKSDSSDQLKGRRNGVTYINNNITPTTATASFGNYPLYIGSRAGTSLRFNGHLYPLIIRGAQSSDAQIASVERYVNGKTKAYA